MNILHVRKIKPLLQHRSRASCSNKPPSVFASVEETEKYWRYQENLWHLSLRSQLPRQNQGLTLIHLTVLWGFLCVCVHTQEWQPHRHHPPPPQGAGTAFVTLGDASSNGRLQSGEEGKVVGVPLRAETEQNSRHTHRGEAVLIHTGVCVCVCGGGCCH